MVHQGGVIILSFLNTMVNSVQFLTIVRQFFSVVLQSSCSDLFLLLCFNVRSRLGPSSVQNMALRKRWSVRRRSDLGLRPWWMPKIPKCRLCRGLGSRTCGVGPNPSRSRVSLNRKKRRLRRERRPSRHRVHKPVIQGGKKVKADCVPDSP